MIVKRDTFPCIVTFVNGDSSHQISIARVVQTEDRIIIARDAPAGPVIIFDEPYSGTPTWNGSEGTVEMVSGTRIEYKKDSACGCGSRLRSWNPYRNIVSSNQDPTA